MHDHTPSLRQGLEGAAVVMIKYGFVLWQVKLSVAVLSVWVDGEPSTLLLLFKDRSDHQRTATATFSFPLLSVRPLLLCGGCFPFLNKAVSPFVSSPPPLHTHH